MHQDLLADRLESLRSFGSREDTPDDVLLELYERQIFLDELAHRKGPRWLLERIVRETRYPEAVITLAIALYTSGMESAAELQSFLEEHSDNYWMLESLALRRPSSDEKAKIFREVAKRHSGGERILRLLQIVEWERQAKFETAVPELQRLLETREPKVWRSLAGNPAAPREVLERLAEARDIPLARDIRSTAKTTLTQISRSSQQNHGHD
ncbi:MAG TPA: hypothetical protein VJ783_04300 [Pirellulales bacterium]|nr:hypothetical protein [Pirellulales bacterium]